MPRPRAETAERILTVEKAARILQAMARSGGESSVADLSRELRVHKSSVSRILGTLAALGFAEQDRRTLRYRLGVEVLKLAGSLVQSMDLSRAAQPYLQRLTKESGETSALTILSRLEGVNIAEVQSPQTLRHVGWLGRPVPLHCTSSGKVLLAFATEELLAQLLQTVLVPYTERTITDAGSLEVELERVRRRGFGVALEEFELGVNAVAAPVRLYTGQVGAALGIAGPSRRLTRERIGELVAAVLRAARDLSESLGFSPNGAGAGR